MAGIIKFPRVGQSMFAGHPDTHQLYFSAAVQGPPSTPVLTPAPFQHPSLEPGAGEDTGLTAPIRGLLIIAANKH